MNIWTNGCYDILHIGHIRLFKYAKSLGDRLIVGIDGDSRIRKSKGSDRPINNEDFRKEMLMSLKYVDDVHIFNSDEELIRLLKINNIDTIVIGDDYKDKYVVGSTEVKSVEFFSKIPNISTSIIYGRTISSRAN